MIEAGARIFISYARDDAKSLALRLRDDLRAAGLTAWMDVADIQGGDNWARTIERVIESCDVGLALCSHKSYQSTYCRAEQMRLQRKGKRIIPLLVQADAEIPLHLEHLNRLDFSQPSQYAERLRDLLSDLNVGRAFASLGGDGEPETGRSVFRPSRLRRLSVPEKRDAPAFRRALAELRREAWLGGRSWWTYFLFHYLDIEAVANVLNQGKLTAARSGGSRRSQDQLLGLNFRPRTPDMWFREGVLPGTPSPDRLPVPVCLLFDLESTICLPAARFTSGDPQVVKRSSATSGALAELPFELIYHDEAPKPAEKDEVLRSRRAQVLVPSPLTLESLQLIWCRSDAEAETLKNQLTDNTREQWRQHIIARGDFALFFRRSAYVDRVLPTADGVLITFWPGEWDDPHHIEIHVQRSGGDDRLIELPAHDLRQPVRVGGPPGWFTDGGEVRVMLDGRLGAHVRIEPFSSVV